jgi:hypothetical protein
MVIQRELLVLATIKNVNSSSGTPNSSVQRPARVVPVIDPVR